MSRAVGDQTAGRVARRWAQRVLQEDVRRREPRVEGKPARFYSRFGKKNDLCYLFLTSQFTSIDDHSLEPFALFDEIVSEWTFEDGEVSCYNYWAVLGQGVLFPTITLVIQARTANPVVHVTQIPHTYFRF